MGLITGGCIFLWYAIWGPKPMSYVICPKCETPYAYSELTNGMCPVCLVKVMDTKEYYEQTKEGGAETAENLGGPSKDSGQPPQPPSGEA